MSECNEDANCSSSSSSSIARRPRNKDANIFFLIPYLAKYCVTRFVRALYKIRYPHSRHLTGSEGFNLLSLPQSVCVCVFEFKKRRRASSSSSFRDRERERDFQNKKNVHPQM